MFAGLEAIIYPPPPPPPPRHFDCFDLIFSVITEEDIKITSDSDVGGNLYYRAPGSQ